MVCHLRIFCILFLVTLSCFSSAQTSIKKNDVVGKWDLNKNAGALSMGDTLVFASGKKANDLFFKRDGTLQMTRFYAYCGNKYFIDYFNRPNKWETIGTWVLLNEGAGKVLKMTIDKQVLGFLFIHADNKHKNLRFERIE